MGMLSLVTVASSWKQSKFLFILEERNELWHAHTMKKYVAVRKNKLPLCARMWVILINKMLSRNSYTKEYPIPCISMCRLKKDFLNQDSEEPTHLSLCMHCVALESIPGKRNSMLNKHHLPKSCPQPHTHVPMHYFIRVDLDKPVCQSSKTSSIGVLKMHSSINYLKIIA